MRCVCQWITQRWILSLQTWGSRCLSSSAPRYTTLPRSNSLTDSPCATWTDTETERNTLTEYTERLSSWERTTHITMQMCGYCLSYLCEIIKRFSTVLGLHFLFFLCFFCFFYLIWNHIFSPTRTFIVSFEWFCFDTKHDWRWEYLGGMGRL